MTKREIIELAAILVNDHGEEAVRIAEQRRAQHADQPGSDAFQLWTSIAAAALSLIERRGRKREVQ